MFSFLSRSKTRETARGDPLAVLHERWQEEVRDASEFWGMHHVKEAKRGIEETAGGLVGLIARETCPKDPIVLLREYKNEPQNIRLSAASGAVAFFMLNGVQKHLIESGTEFDKDEMLAEALHLLFLDPSLDDPAYFSHSLAPLVLEISNALLQDKGPRSKDMLNAFFSFGLALCYQTDVSYKDLKLHITDAHKAFLSGVN